MHMQCGRCGTTEPERFYLYTYKGANIRKLLKGFCKPCYDKDLKERNPGYRKRQTENHRKWLANPENRERARASERKRSAKRKLDPNYKEQSKLYRIKQEYGLTPEQYDTLIAAGCAICGSFDRLHVDHCHDKGHVRAALCHSCNIGLGFVERPNGWLERALEYLRRTSDAGAHG
ncbi:hypothetical protein BZM27_05910 [Paraburkholderia steynii]|uniref:Recombination endonuclease VII n=1 Tax=Paraburkholderia steynii TaxID=1245441 RepID=A0A4R0XKD1_9BURK|nr:hypothetical protein BZM27_05910 [Paraburkholderia steynii]